MIRKRVFSVLEWVLNLGGDTAEDIQKIRLIRQVNGLCAFFILVALSVGISLTFVPGSGMVATLQFVALGLYFFCLMQNARGNLKLANRMVVEIFEWHLFLAMVLTDMWHSSAVFIIVLYPLFAALVEMSIRRHLLVSLFQASLLLSFHLFLPELEIWISRISNFGPQASFVLMASSIYFIPVIGAVIICIISTENIRTREKQRKLIYENSLAKKKLEYYANQLKDETRRLQAELDIARKIQTMVLPASAEFRVIPDLDIACIMRSADEVGGDYYDLFRIGDITVIGIGDVTGHGLSSGIIMLMAQTAIRALAECEMVSPSELLVTLNRVLFSNIARIREDRNMTLAVFFHQGHRFRVSGQHESFIICREDGKIENIDTILMGYYVGMIPDISDTVRNFDFQLNPGDLLFLYSDGVTEAENEQHEQFGMRRMLEGISRYHTMESAEIRAKMMRDLYNFMGQREILDDITMFVIKQK